MPPPWTTVEQAGHAVDLLDLPADRPRRAVLFLHDDGITLPDRPGLTRPLVEAGVGVLGPHGGPCWWADRLCPDFDPALTPERWLLDHVVPFARSRWSLAPGGLGLLGVGMGGQGALRLAFKHPGLFPVVAALAASLDHHELMHRGTALDAMYDSAEQCRQDTALLHVHPTRFPPHVFFAADPADPWYRGNDRLHEKLGALGIPHQFDGATRAGGHSCDYHDHLADRAVRFLLDGLDRESRRLL
jgi:S-formylglutathione hydrolase